jgi:hypothetical protein
MAQEGNDINGIDRVEPSDQTLAHPDSENDVLDLKPSEHNVDADDDTPAEAEQIMGQIEETRSQMGETIDAIQDRLSFSNLSEQVSEHVTNAVETAKDAVYDATIGKAANMMKNLTNDISGSKIVQTAKRNPLPFVLIGVGAGLLAYQGYTGKLSGTRNRRRELGEMDDRKLATRSPITDAAREKVSGVTEKVTATASNAMEKVSGAVDSAYSSAGELVHKAYDRAGELGTSAHEMYDHQLEENPLAVGAVALGLGAAIGFAIPSTRYEGEMLGGVREQFMEKAQDTAATLLDKTKQVVTEAGKNATQQIGSTREH